MHHTSYARYVTVYPDYWAEPWPEYDSECDASSEGMGGKGMGGKEGQAVRQDPDPLSIYPLGADSLAARMNALRAESVGGGSVGGNIVGGGSAGTEEGKQRKGGERRKGGEQSKGKDHCGALRGDQRFGKITWSATRNYRLVELKAGSKLYRCK
jgi:hypothetical protein